MIDEALLDTPWRAPSAPTFQVGDRVRIRLSAECRCEGAYNSIQKRLGLIGHPGITDGMFGTIRFTSATKPRFVTIPDGHPIDVVIDGGYDVQECHYDRQAFAPNELELIQEKE